MAFTPEEILELVLEKVEIMKTHESRNKNIHRNKSHHVSRDMDNMEDLRNLPEYYPGYNESVSFWLDIIPHTNKGVFPERLFVSRSPHETPKEYEYRRANYKQITLPMAVDYNSTVNRAWGSGNWGIKYQEDDASFVRSGETFQEYVDEEIKDYDSLTNYMINCVASIKRDDANGVIAVKPEFLSTEEVEDEDGKVSTVLDNELIRPQPFYYNTIQVISWLDENHALIELDEKSLVKVGSNKVAEGLIYEFYDDENIWHIVQVGKKEDFKFEPRLFYNHAWGKLPVEKLKGVPKIDRKTVVYQSPYLFAVENLDIALLDSSNLQIAKANGVYPYRIMLGNLCDFEDTRMNAKCERGFIWDVDGNNGNGARHECPKCNGMGLVSRISPQGELLINPGDRTDEGDVNIDPSKAISYVAPDVTTLKFLQEQINEHEAKGRRILHLASGTDQTKTEQERSATARKEEQKATAAFIKPISNETFSLYRFMLDAIGWMRYGEAYKSPLLSVPNSFDLRDEQDFIEEISMATKAGVAPWVIQNIYIEFIRTVFSTEKFSTQIFALVVKADRLMPFTLEQIDKEVATNKAANWEAILHASALSFIELLINDNPDYLMQPIEEQIEQLFEVAKKKAAEVQTTNQAARPVNNTAAQIISETAV